jgi:cytochrome c biogenesis protein CcdA
MIDFFFYVDQLIQGKSLLALPLAFVSGILLSLTPCSYPLIPIILGIAEVNEQTSRRRAMIISLIFVGGLVAVYMALGLMSALFGVLFGSLAKHWMVQALLGLLLIALGLVMFDLFHLNVNLQFNINTRKYGVFGVFLLGVLSGVSVTGCMLPVFGSILLVIAQRQDALFGVLTLAAFSLGMGSVYFLFAVFGRQFFVRLEKKPGLMLWIKRILGGVIILLGLYFLKTAFSGV